MVMGKGIDRKPKRTCSNSGFNFLPRTSTITVFLCISSLQKLLHVCVEDQRQAFDPRAEGESRVLAVSGMLRDLFQRVQGCRVPAQPLRAEAELNK